MVPIFNTIVLTAANESQADSYRAQLESRQEIGLIPENTQCLVIADPGERRVGSGTSTLNVLVQLLSQNASKDNGFLPCSSGNSQSGINNLYGQRILIAHSGGDARRLPAYAAQGKIFLPLPCDVPIPSGPSWRRFPATIFDLLWRRLALLPCPTEGQIIVCSGDVLLTFDASQTEMDTEGGICGLGFAAAPSVAEQHGVYITSNPSVGGTVTGFLQKPTLEQMNQQNALDLTGRALVDSGVFALAPQAAMALLEAAGVSCANNQVTIGAGLYDDALSHRVGLVDFYQEIALALPRSTSKEAYFKGIEQSTPTAEAKVSLGNFFDQLHQAALPFSVSAVPDGEFFHIGTSRDLLIKFTQTSRTSRSSAFRNGWRSTTQTHDYLRHTERELGNKPMLFNVQGPLDHIATRGAAFIEQCDFTQCDFPNSVARSLVLRGDNILIGWNNGSQLNLGELPQGIGLAYLPIRKHQPDTAANATTETTAETLSIPLLFGIDDDNKKSLESGQCLFLNQNIQNLLDVGITKEMLWADGDEKSTWMARLWLLEEPATALPHLLVAAGVTQVSYEARCLAARQLQALWENRERLSWAELMRRTDTQALLDARQRLSAQFECERIFDDLLQNEDFPAREAISRLEEFIDIQAAESTLHKIHAWHEQSEAERRTTQTEVSFEDSLTKARIWSAAALIAEFVEKHQIASPALSGPTETAAKHQSDKVDESAHKTPQRLQYPAHYNSLALHAVSSAVERSVILAHQPRPAAIQEDQVVWATAPARIDFAGGWSDTPPICFERGGLVLNAAVTINRQYPIQVIAKLNAEKCIRLTSIDLGKQEVHYEAEDINRTPDLLHWSSLAKAALVLSGIVPDAHYPGQEKQTLSQWLDVLGGGLDLTLFSGLPKGSGMGTSSILGAATLACLANVQGQELTHAELISQTSLLEQRMTSGGGWQDQIGGIVAGVKLIRTEPGISQNPALQWSVFGAPGHGERSANSLDGTSDLLSRRMLLYFTGQKRLAKNILQNVVKRYLAREAELLSIVDRLKHGAQEAKWALEANDIVAFAHQVSAYWELKKAIDPGSTNAEVEAILARVHHLTSGYSLCGAGGGGFMLLIAHDEEAANTIRHELQSNPPNPHARFFHFAIDHQGLSVTTL